MPQVFDGASAMSGVTWLPPANSEDPLFTEAADRIFADPPPGLNAMMKIQWDLNSHQNKVRSPSLHTVVRQCLMRCYLELLLVNASRTVCAVSLWEPLQGMLHRWIGRAAWQIS